MGYYGNKGLGLAWDFGGHFLGEPNLWFGRGEKIVNLGLKVLCYIKGSLFVFSCYKRCYRMRGWFFTMIFAIGSTITHYYNNGVMQNTTDLKNVYFHLSEDCVRCFPKYGCMPFSLISISSGIIVTGTKQLLVAIRCLFLTMKKLFFETFGRNLDLCWRRALDANFEAFI